MRDRTYRLYGVTVRTSVVLPGARAVLTAARPDLELRRADREEIAARRGRRRPRPVWRGGSPDGAELLVVDRRGGERAFLHPGGTFHLGEDAVLSFAPEPGTDELAWTRALLGSVLVSISLQRGFEALRSSAVDIDGRVVAFAGASAPARTSLAAELVRRGHSLVCDGALTLAREGTEIRAEPGPPHLSLPLEPGRSTAPSSVGVTIATVGSSAWVNAHRATTAGRPLGAIYLLEQDLGRRPRPGAMPVNPMVLLAHALSIDGAASRARRCFDLYRVAVCSVPIHRLPAAQPPAELAELVEAGAPAAGAEGAGPG